MSWTFDGSNDYLTKASISPKLCQSSNVGTDMTVLLWVKATNYSTYRGWFALSGAGVEEAMAYYHSGNGASYAGGKNASSDGSSAACSISGTPSTGSWVLISLRADVTAKKFKFGIGTTYNESSVYTNNPTSEGYDQIWVGASTSYDSPDKFFIGKAAHFAIYQGHLTDAQISSAVGGTNPADFDGATGTNGTITLKHYFPGTDGSFVATVGGLTLSESGGVGTDSGDNPAVNAAGGGQSAVPILMTHYEG